MNVVNDSDVRIEKLSLGPFETNAYIVFCRETGASLVVDAPAQAGKIIRSLHGTRPAYVLLTHDHADHTGALAELRSELNVPLVAHAADAGQLGKPPEIQMTDGNMISLGNLNIEVRHTPGHTPGSLCFLIGRYLLCGDTIFPGGPGKTWSPEDFRQILDSITARVLTLPEDTRIFPGHGNDTTVKIAREEYAVFASRPHGADLCGDVLWLSS